MSERPGKGRARPTAFRVGLLVGMALLLIMGVLVYAAHRWAAGPPVPYSVQVISAGSALDRAGARQLDVRATYGRVMRQRCNGACDDLSHQANGSDVTYGLEVRDAKGRCIACDTLVYVPGSNFVASLVIRDGATSLVSAEHSWPNGERSRESASPTAK